MPQLPRRLGICFNPIRSCFGLRNPSWLAWRSPAISLRGCLPCRGPWRIGEQFTTRPSRSPSPTHTPGPSHSPSPPPVASPIEKQ
jgi:hypothetical protein